MINNPDFYYFETIDSTNSEARRKIEEGISLPAVFIAENQTLGRGRRGRSFFSEGGLYMSLAIDTREKENIEIFADYMAQIHCKHLESDINNYVESISLDVADKTKIVCEMADKWLINPVLADKLADILVFVAHKPVFSSKEIVSHFGFSETTVRRFLRKLLDLGYINSQGGNRNRTYILC